MLLCLQSLLWDGIQDGQKHLHVNVRQTNVHNIECNLKHKGENNNIMLNKYKSFIVVVKLMKSMYSLVQYFYKPKVRNQFSKKGKVTKTFVDLLLTVMQYNVPESAIYQYITCITHKIYENWHPAHKL